VNDQWDATPEVVDLLLVALCVIYNVLGGMWQTTSWNNTNVRRTSLQVVSMPVRAKWTTCVCCIMIINLSNKRRSVLTFGAAIAAEIYVRQVGRIFIGGASLVSAIPGLSGACLLRRASCTADGPLTPGYCSLRPTDLLQKQYSACPTAWQKSSSACRRKDTAAAWL